MRQAGKCRHNTGRCARLLSWAGACPYASPAACSSFRVADGECRAVGAHASLRAKPPVTRLGLSMDNLLRLNSSAFDLRSTTNYVTLLDQLRRVRAKNEPVLLVTFNYDRMIEGSLSSVNLSISEFQHYIQNDAFKLFKLHGSVNWVREVGNQVINISEFNDWQVAYDLINMAPELKISDRFRIIDSRPKGKVDDIPLFPAIALPVETKVDFECPPDHLDCLRAHIGKVTKLVTIGWAAQEQHFLKLLKKHLAEGISIFAVAEGKQQAIDVLERIKAAGIDAKDEEAAEGGFTECTVKREFEKFLKA